MKSTNVPFNISLLQLDAKNIASIRPVTSLSHFDNTGVNFHPDGLFSTIIFGKSGERIRSERFSYINIKADVFHPLLFKAYCSLKSLYEGILHGREYAKWDDQAKDFIPAMAGDGAETGFNFFLSHYRDIVFGETKSIERSESITLLKNNLDGGLTHRVVVLPAGLRDIEYKDDGRIQEDEINLLYRRLLTAANTINSSTLSSSKDIADTARLKIQLTFVELFDLLKSMIEGKKKLILGKWASRSIYNGTRNVITAMSASMPVLGEPGRIGPNHTVIGLYQASRAALPVSIYQMKNGYLADIAGGVSLPVKLVNPQTLKQESVRLKSDIYDKWFSDEGIDKLLVAYGQEYIRHKAIMVGDHYLALIYKAPDGGVRLLGGIDELPEHLDKTRVSPVTYSEFLYLQLGKRLNELPIYLTRYPAVGIGSIYPAMVYCRTTVNAEQRHQLDHTFTRIADEPVFHEFPIRGEAFINTLSPHPIHINKLGADFDGDTASGNIGYADETIEEVRLFLQTRKAYINTDGNLIYSSNVDPIRSLMYNLTGD